MRPTGSSTNLRILLDTHVLVYREFPGGIPIRYIELFKAITESKVLIVVHPVSLQEIASDENLQNRQSLLSKLGTYPQLADPPDPDKDTIFRQRLGPPDTPRDYADHQLLYCVYKKAVDYLVTDDRRMRSDAKLVGLTEIVLTVKRATDLMREIGPRTSGGMPTLCFYNIGDYWVMGEKGHEMHLEAMDGFDYIWYLLKYADASQDQEPVTAIDLFNRFKQPGDFEPKKGVQAQNLDGREDILKLGGGDRAISAEDVEEAIKLLKAKMEHESYDGPEDLLKIKNGIAELQKLLVKKTRKGARIRLRKPPRDHRSQSELARVNLTNRIRDALNKIVEKEVPLLPLYLNRSTIKGGDHFRYVPAVGHRPNWILDR